MCQSIKERWLPLLLSSSTGSLSHLSVVNWKEPTRRSSVPISVFLSVLYQSLSEHLCSYRACARHAMSRIATLSSPGNFLNTMHVRKGHRLGRSKQVHACLVPHPGEPRVHLEFDSHGAARASRGSILIQPPLCACSKPETMELRIWKCELLKSHGAKFFCNTIFIWVCLGQGNPARDWFKGLQNMNGVYLDAVSVCDSGRLVQSNRSVCGLWDTSSTGCVPSAPAPLNLSSLEWQRRSKRWRCTKRVSLSPGTGWEPSHRV